MARAKAGDTTEPKAKKAAAPKAAAPKKAAAAKPVAAKAAAPKKAAAAKPAAAKPAAPKKAAAAAKPAAAKKAAAPKKAAKPELNAKNVGNAALGAVSVGARKLQSKADEVTSKAKILVAKETAQAREAVKKAADTLIRRVNLQSSYVEALEKLGGGDLTAGIKKAAEKAIKALRG